MATLNVLFTSGGICLVIMASPLLSWCSAEGSESLCLCTPLLSLRSISIRLPHGRTRNFRLRNPPITEEKWIYLCWLLGRWCAFRTNAPASGLLWHRWRRYDRTGCLTLLWMTAGRCYAPVQCFGWRGRPLRQILTVKVICLDEGEFLVNLPLRSWLFNHSPQFLYVVRTV